MAGCNTREENAADLAAEETDAHKSSDSMDEEVLRQLVTDLWWFIENVDGLNAPERSDRFFALHERVIEALNLDE